jgi:anti-sigma-K factor RskA
MNNSRQIDPEDLALYAMQMLGLGEAADVEAYLEQSAPARRELAEIRGDLAMFAMSADAAAPAASVRTRFLRQVAEEKRPAARPVAQASQRSGAEAGVASIGAYRAGHEQESVGERAVAKKRGAGAQILSWAGWAVAAGLAFTAGELYRERQTLRETVAGNQSAMVRTAADAATAREVLSALNDQTAMRVTLTRQGVAPSPTGRTTYSAEKGVLIFTASNLEPVDTYKVYELWLIPADGAAPIPAGTFHPDAKGYANLISTAMPKGVEAKAFGITVEDDGGSKVPTPPILMTGA